MFRHDMGDGMRLGLVFQVPVDPGALGPLEDRLGRRLVGRQRPIVEIGRIVQVTRLAVGAEFHVQDSLRDDAPLARAGNAAVLQRVFDGEEHPGR